MWLEPGTVEPENKKSWTKKERKTNSLNREKVRMCNSILYAKWMENREHQKANKLMYFPSIGSFNSMAYFHSTKYLNINAIAKHNKRTAPAKSFAKESTIIEYILLLYQFNVHWQKWNDFYDFIKELKMKCVYYLFTCLMHWCLALRWYINLYILLSELIFFLC